MDFLIVNNLKLKKVVIKIAWGRGIDMYNIYNGTGWNKQLVGCYDDDSIYILKQVYSRERVAYYNKQEIKNNDFISTTMAYCKEDKLYDSMLLSNYLGYYNNGYVYDRYGNAVGEYEGVNGQCAGALLLVTELSSKIQLLILQMGMNFLILIAKHHTINFILYLLQLLVLLQ